MDFRLVWVILTFALIKLAKKLKDGGRFLSQTRLFPLIKLAKKLKGVEEESPKPNDKGKVSIN
ncbi:MAG: hypothetical protein ACKPGT_22840 [Microcystis sp.]